MTSDVCLFVCHSVYVFVCLVEKREHYSASVCPFMYLCLSVIDKKKFLVQICVCLSKKTKKKVCLHLGICFLCLVKKKEKNRGLSVSRSLSSLINKESNVSVYLYLYAVFFLLTRKKSTSNIFTLTRERKQK